MEPYVGIHIQCSTHTGKGGKENRKTERDRERQRQRERERGA